jgi:hypothetical protein
MEHSPAEIPALDEHLYERFKAIGSVLPSTYLAASQERAAEQKQQFLAGAVENPDFDFPRITLDDLLDKEQACLNFKKVCCPKKKNELLRKIYLWKINEKIAMIRMLICATRAKEHYSASKKWLRRFQKYSEYIYGKPSQEAFHAHLEQIYKNIEKAKISGRKELAEAAEELEWVLPLLRSDLKRPELPKQNVIDLVQNSTRKEVERFIHLPEKKPKYTSSDLIEIFQKAIAELRNQNWQVIEETSAKSSLSVDFETMSIRVPPVIEKNLKSVVQAIIHKIGTHALRFKNGERSRLKLLGLELDRYTGGEEGVAKIREHAYHGEFENYFPSESHLAIALAYGLDGQKRNFRKVYEILFAYHYFQALRRDKKGVMTPEKAVQFAQEKAWNRCMRTFIGTDCSTPGICFSKDIIYSKGSIAFWEALSKNTDEIRRLSIGKYDPSNPRHLWILEQIGITYQDLESLAK